MPSDFLDQVVVVTGASAGIGAVAATEIVARGGSVVLAARRADLLTGLAHRLGARAHAVVADVTVRADVERILDEAIAKFGRVDIWINNAGRGITRPVLELTDDDVDAMVRDNVKSVLYGMQVAVPHFKARGTGAIVNVSSMLGRIPFAPIRSAYSAAKAAMQSLTETLRMELLRPYPSLRVVVVYPGPVATDFGKNVIGPATDNRALPNVQTAEEVANVLLDAALHSRGDVYTPAGALARVHAHLDALAK